MQTWTSAREIQLIRCGVRIRKRRLRIVRRLLRLRIVVVHAPPPNLDPAWPETARPPAGSLSKLRVRCWECQHPHLLRERRMWNGTHSECPGCGKHAATTEDD